MEVQNYTEKAQAALQGAHSLAVRMKHAELTTMHLLLALAEQEDGVAPHVLEKMGYNVNALISGGRALLDKEAQVSGGGRKLAASMDFNEVLVCADTEAQQLPLLNEVVAGLARARFHGRAHDGLPVPGPERAGRGIVSQLTFDGCRRLRRTGRGEACVRGRRDASTFRVEAHTLDLPAVDVIATEVDPLTTGIDARVRRARAHVRQHERGAGYARFRVHRCAQDVRDARSIRSPDEIAPVGTPIRSQIQSSVCSHLVHDRAVAIEYDDVVVRAASPTRNGDPPSVR